MKLEAYRCDCCGNITPYELSEVKARVRQHEVTLDLCDECRRRSVTCHSCGLTIMNDLYDSTMFQEYGLETPNSPALSIMDSRGRDLCMACAHEILSDQMMNDCKKI